MHWILQNNIYSEEGFAGLVQAIERLGLPYSIHKCIPFVGKLDPEPKPTQPRVVVMGSYTLAHEAKRRRWFPGVFLNDNFSFQIQRAYWGEEMINYPAKLYTFEEVDPQTQPFFCRPIGDGKEFIGKVMDWGEFSAWRDKVLEFGDCLLTRKTGVMVAPVQQIYAEYRTWIIDRKPVCWSQYKIGSIKRYLPNVPDTVLEYAKTRAHQWSPHRAYVLDIFDTPDGLKIGEVNCLNAAGFYAADMSKLVQSIEKAFDSYDYDH